MANTGVSAANIKLGADISGLLSGLRTATQAINQHTHGINIGLTRAYKEADAAAKTFRSGISRLGTDLQDIGKKMTFIGTLPVLFAGAASFKGFAEIQKLKIGLDQYGESLQTVKELAKLPNIGIEGAAKSLIQLRAVGVESEMAQRGIKAFANALTAAGKSSVDLNPALTNVVQMLSTGVVSAVDVKELANRIPQARKALMDAFGTASGEELTKIGPEKVIQALIEQLEKIPPVAGGASMAMEKFSDSAQFASATIGETLDKAFGLTGIINGLAESMEGAANYFAELSPETQKLSATMVALAAAVPIVTVAIGAMITATSAAAVGLGIAAGTFAAIAAAVVVGGALIITYWDEIKGFLTETGVWTTLSGLAESTLGIIVNAFKAVGSLLMGNWKGLWTDLRNTVANAVNFLNTVMFGLAKQVGLLVASITSLIGMDSLGKWIREKSHGLDDLVKKLNISQKLAPGQSVVSSNDYGKQFAADDKQQKQWEEQQERLKKMKPAVDVASMSITELEKKLGDLNEAYKSLRPTEEGYSKMKANIAGQVRQITSLIDKQGASLKDAGKHIKDAADSYVQMSKAAFEMWKLDLAMKHQQETNALKAKIKEYKELFGVVAKLNVETQKSRPMSFGDDRLKNLRLDGVSNEMNMIGSIQAKPDAFQQIRDAIDSSKELMGLFSADWSNSQMMKFLRTFPQKVGESLTGYKSRIKDYVAALELLEQQMTDAVVSLKTNVAIAVGEGLGDALSGLEGGLKGVGKNILAVFADVLSQLGKAMLTWAVTVTTAKIALKSLNPVIAAAAGLAAIVAGKFLKNSIAKTSATTRFAKGALVYGEMNAVVGDNPNAHVDPEVISPLSKLEGMIKKSLKETGGGGGNVFIGDVTIRGEDLRVAFRRAEQSNKALKGR